MRDQSIIQITVIVSFSNACFINFWTLEQNNNVWFSLSKKCYFKFLTNKLDSNYKVLDIHTGVREWIIRPTIMSLFRRLCHTDTHNTYMYNKLYGLRWFQIFSHIFSPVDEHRMEKGGRSTRPIQLHTLIFHYKRSTYEVDPEPTSTYSPFLTLERITRQKKPAVATSSAY